MTSQNDPFEALHSRASAFNQRLTDARQRIMPANGSPWYQWGSIGNVWYFDQFLTAQNRQLLGNIEGKVVADIGCADGDLGLFFSSLGADVDLVDNPSTNMNGFVGARTLAEELGLKVNFHAVDLDSQFHLPRDHYDIILFLGILYHLKNPFYALERLKHHGRHVFLSTRIARYTPNGVDLSESPVAYLVDPLECNRDPSNYWIFSLPGLVRLCTRAGWRIVEAKTFGDTVASNPADNDHDERAFLLLESDAYRKEEAG